MELRWLPEARDDIQRLYEYLIDKNAAAAERAIRLIQTGANLLLENPELGKPMDDDTKRRELALPFGASAYILRYRLHENAIVVIRIWHGKEQRL